MPTNGIETVTIRRILPMMTVILFYPLEATVPNQVHLAELRPFWVAQEVSHWVPLHLENATIGVQTIGMPIQLMLLNLSLVVLHGYFHGEMYPIQILIKKRAEISVAFDKLSIIN